MFTGPALVAFAAIFFMIFAVGRILAGRRSADFNKTHDRLRELSAANQRTAPQKTGLARVVAWIVAMLDSWTSIFSKRHSSKVQAQLLRAGYFRPNAQKIFTASRIGATFLLACGAGIGAYSLGVKSSKAIVFWSSCGCAVGFLAPGIWLNGQLRKRRGQLLGAFPDAVDMLVLCLEGGASFNAAMLRLTDELQVVHPELGTEMNIVQREMQLGLSAGEAIKKFAERCGLSDVRDLAVVILQSERYGASITKALRIYADSVRLQRQEDAEEMAQKAAVKILFPTLLCIFPAIFIVILGPAAFQTAKLFSG
jgi:tight adherence protein C